jgi:protein tyrosine phosphatase (PTP) superfamily phosphohydrolase (DUF442 family)
MNFIVELGFIVSSPMAFVMIALAIAFFGGEGGPGGDGPYYAERPACWAKPLLLPGVCNLHKVSDDLYRSAQPTAEGLRNLKANGIKAVVSLCYIHSDLQCGIKDIGLKYEPIPMHAWHPEEEEIITFLRIVNDKQNTPVLVHCTHGADRTGAMCAVYRIFVQGWSKQEALQEMTTGGFGFHMIWQDLPEFIEGLDATRIKAAAGITEGN